MHTSKTNRRRRLFIEPLEQRRLLAVFTVTSVQSHGAGSLAEAIISANGLPGEDKIIFDPTLYGTTIVLSASLPEITDPLEIDGPYTGLTLAPNNRGAIRIAPSSVEVELSDIEINGNASGSLIEVNGSSLVLNEVTLQGSVSASAINAIDSNVVVEDSTLTNNTASDYGGAIFAQDSAVRLNNVTLTNNRANGRGGGVGTIDSQLTITNSDISSNSALNQGSLSGGGGVSATGGVATIHNTTIFANSAQGSGGGASLWADFALIHDSTISSNTASGSGGGVAGNNLTISGSVISGNSATSTGGGVSGGSVTISSSSVSGNMANYGGGAAFFSNSTGYVIASAIVDNTAHVGGGGIEARSVVVERSTVSRNAAPTFAAGIHTRYLYLNESIVSDNYGDGMGAGSVDYSAAEFVVLRSTISGNQGTGINAAETFPYRRQTAELPRRGNLASGQLILEDSTVSGNQRDVRISCGNYIGCSGRIERSTVMGLSVYGDGSVRLFSNALSSASFGGDLWVNTRYNVVASAHSQNIFDDPSDVVGVGDLRLGPLADNGGPTPTRLPLVGSPVVNAGDPNYLEPPMFDQRGAPFERISGGRIDVGAVEFQQPSFFESAQQQLGNNSSYSVAMADVDGDGDADAFVSNSFGGARVYLNDGSGLFTDSGQSIGSGNQTFVQLADLDGDGQVDAFISTDLGNEVWMNSGGGVFVNSGQLFGGKANELALADVNGDGNIDAVTVSRNAPNRLWINDGNAQFSDSGQSLGTDDGRGLALADLNGDDHVDLFVVNARQPDRVWLNDGAGTFVDTGQTLGSENGRSVATVI